jgi:site-specific DNA-methyltransferase (adenine-specific)
MEWLNETFCADCMELLPELPCNSVDMVLCDLPYGTTQNKWDNVIPLAPLWEQYRRVLKSGGAVVLTAAQPFAAALVCSNLSEFKYEWIWEKDNGTGFLNAKKQPLRLHEQVLVFYSSQCVYRPQMEPGKPYVCKAGAKSKNYGAQVDVTTVNTGERYPKTVLRFARDKGKVHPTQKPVALFEYLIRTYTNDGATVLDNCCGAGTTGVACQNTGRNFIQIDSDEKYCSIARSRLNLNSL